MTDKQDQVIAQCRVVVDLAHQLADLYMDLAIIHAGGDAADLLDMHGNRTARLMERLGDHLNGLDAVDPDDAERHGPIFERAQQMFPQPMED